MPVSEICNREVVIAGRNDSIREAANLMREHHVGDLVIVEEKGGVKVPVGIVTDRDLVLEILAPGVDQKIITIGDIMPASLASVTENTGIFEAIEYMRTKGVRRLPVVDKNGGLVGILSLDDLLELLAEELYSISKLVRYEMKNEIKTRQ